MASLLLLSLLRLRRPSPRAQAGGPSFCRSLPILMSSAANPLLPRNLPIRTPRAIHTHRTAPASLLAGQSVNNDVDVLGPRQVDEAVAMVSRFTRLAGVRRDEFRHGCRYDLLVAAAAAQVGREESLDFLVQCGLRLDAREATDVQSSPFVLRCLPV